MTPLYSYPTLVLTSLLAPAACLVLAAPLDGGLPAHPVAPFGWWNVLAVDLLAGLPLVVLLATGPAARRPARRRLAACALAGAVLATVVLGLFVGLILDTQGAGWAARFLVRLGWVLSLQVPLGVLLAPLVPVWTDGRSPLVLLAGVIALVLPAVHEYDRIQAGTRQAEDLLREGQLAAAVPVLDALRALGSSRPVLGKPPLTIRAELEQQLRQLRAVLDRYAPHPMPPEVRIERARILAVLGRPDEAVEMLSPIGTDNLDAVLLLASIRQKQKRFADSDGYYRRAGELLAAAPAGPAVWEQRRRVVDGLAFNARERGAYVEAERLYQRAIEEMPELEAHFQFQLGRHYHQGGRPRAAARHFARAVELGGDRYRDAARQFTEEMRQQTPGCFFGGSGQ